MKQKTILVLTNNIGGLHSFRKEVMKAMIDTGYRVVISHPDGDERVGYFTSIGCEDQITEFDRRGINPIKDIQLLINYCKLIKTCKPMAVLTYTIKPNVYGGLACRLMRTPQLANVTGLGDSIENEGVLQKISILLYRIGLSRAERVFFQNQYNRTFCIENGIASKESILLPGSGVNLAHHTYQDYPFDDTVRFLFIGRLIKSKGIEEFFEAATRLKEVYSNIEFQVLGSCEGDYLAKLDDLVGRRVIKYLGSTSDVRPFIRDVHCTIMPSYHEGMSNVNLESAANGRPVITTNVPGCIETVVDGITGFVCESKSASSLTEAVVRFLNLSYEERQEMGIAARQKVEREFDRQIVVDQYLSTLKRL